MKKTVIRISLVCLVLVVIAGTFSMAQDRGRRWDPERFQEMIMNRIQESLNATDEEWKIIQPRIEKVWELQQETRMGGFGRRLFGPPPGRGGRDRGDSDRGPRDRGDRDRGPRGRGFGPEPSPEAEALQKALDSDNTSVDDIKAKLAAFREARDQKEKKLEEAQKELKEVLTIRQEALLVLMGTLE